MLVLCVAHVCILHLLTPQDAAQASASCDQLANIKPTTVSHSKLHKERVVLDKVLETHYTVCFVSKALICASPFVDLYIVIFKTELCSYI